MKTSVVIPSTNNHFKYLDAVLTSYVRQTIKPEEVVISVANGHLIDQLHVQQLKNKYKEFFENIEIISHNKVVPEGPNRGEGTKVASNELILYNDSDDLAHPQRVQVVKQAFENFDVVHLNHAFSFDEKFSQLQAFEMVESDAIFEMYFPSFLSTPQNERIRANRPRKVFDKNGSSLPYGAGMGLKQITGGSLCILKNVTETIEWEWAMDVSYDYDFCMDTLFYFKKSILIDAPLIWYNKTGNMEWYSKIGESD